LSTAFQAADPLQCSVEAGSAELASRPAGVPLKHAAALIRLALRASAAPQRPETQGPFDRWL